MNGRPEETQAAAQETKLRLWLWRRLYDRNRRVCERKNDWHQDHHAANRLQYALCEWRNWWDWGHPLMALIGRADGGSYGPPEPRPWWFHQDDGSLTVARTYDEYTRINEGCAGEKPYWHYINVQDDGFTLIPGNVYDSGGQNYGLDREAARLLVRYIVVEWQLKANWLGARRWLYYKALHAAVNRKIPFTCQAVPAAGTGGFPHWHCELHRRHDGPHRFRNYVWRDGTGALYMPADEDTLVTRNG